MSSSALPARVKALEMFAGIHDELAAVETAIERALATRDRLVGEVSTHLLRAGGKRIRPALVLLSGKFPGYTLERLLPVAVAVELIHMATLVHDDVVDGAELRRGAPTVNSHWNSRVSVLAGDYLFAKAFSMLAETGENQVVRTMADVVFEMSRGELVQMASYFDTAQTEADYTQRICQKTAYLIAECCRLGALMAGASGKEMQAMYDYGLGVGLSFQIADDLLDFMGSSSEVGKPVCGDLKSGILTVPVIHALANSPRADELRTLVQQQHIGDAEVKTVKAILEESQSFTYARQKAAAHLSRALDSLSHVRRLASRETLQVLAEFVVNRQF